MTTSSDSSFAWPTGCRAAVSISFDDARPSQLDQGMPILDRHNVKATFYASLAPVEARQEDWRAACARGHEIGNHTTSHACTGNFPWSSRRKLENFTAAEMEKDILDASDMLQSLTGVRPVTFAYPCGQSFIGRGVNQQSYVPIVARHFTAGRGWMTESIADPAFCDLAYVPVVRLDGTPWQDILPVLEKARDDGRWIAFAGHDVGTQGKQSVIPDTLDKLCAWCTDKQNGVWIDTIANIATYVAANQKLQPVTA